MPKPRKHKRGRAKHQRAGCLLCKPWKDERDRQDQLRYVRARQSAEAQMREL
ncbi:MAG: hypothetical protein HY681_07740 [Chloroflexi bacterium]|nr:hypothetical protein [Chloroflexota bacterium]